MYKDRRVGVVIPAYNEERLISKTLETLPDFVDRVVVIDDGSEDATAEKVRDSIQRDSRIEILQSDLNEGVGAAVVRGYRHMLSQEVDLVAVMGGDAQSDPAYLHNLLDRLIESGYDMAKGNRLFHSESARSMPKYRVLGNTLLTLFSKAASGYWSIADSQNGYIALRTDTLRRLNLSRITRGYDLENSMLIELNILSARVADVPMPAVYGEEVSGIRVWRVVPRMLLTMFSGFWKRIYLKYVLYSFHPVALFLFSGLALTFWGLGFGIWVTSNTIGPETASTGTVMLAVLPFLMGFQLLLAALVLDILFEPK